MVLPFRSKSRAIERSPDRRADARGALRISQRSRAETAREGASTRLSRSAAEDSTGTVVAKDLAKRRTMKPNRRRLGTTDLEITTVGFGAWAIGGGGWAYGWGP